MTARIRTAQLSDSALLPDIERSASKSFRAIPELAWIDGHDVTPADVQRAYIAKGTVWVAEEADGRLIGFLTAEVLADEMHIWEFAVRHDFQGHGAGRRLMSSALGHAHAKGLTAVTLTTFRDVSWNGPFYARLGFETLSGPEIGQRLAAILENEVARGLPGDRRCAMRYRIQSQPA